MSITKNFGRPATRSNPSASGPFGFGVWKVPFFSQRSCQRDSIWLARRASYRNGAWPPLPVPAAKSVLSAGWVVSAGWTLRARPMLLALSAVSALPLAGTGRPALLLMGSSQRSTQDLPCQHQRLDHGAAFLVSISCGTLNPGGPLPNRAAANFGGRNSMAAATEIPRLAATETARLGQLRRLRGRAAAKLPRSAGKRRTVAACIREVGRGIDKRGLVDGDAIFAGRWQRPQTRRSTATTRPSTVASSPAIGS